MRVEVTDPTKKAAAKDKVKQALAKTTTITTSTTTTTTTTTTPPPPPPPEPIIFEEPQPQPDPPRGIIERVGTFFSALLGGGGNGDYATNVVIGRKKRNDADADAVVPKVDDKKPVEKKAVDVKKASVEKKYLR